MPLFLHKIFLKVICDNFGLFLDKHNDLDSEYLVPDVINSEVFKGNISLSVCDTNSKWYGVTYKDDKDMVIEAISKYIQDGVYPKKLF